MRESVITTSARGLRTDVLPYRLYRKAKRLGIWNPEDIDFSQDQKDWAEMTPEGKHRLLRLLSMFQAGEEAVTLDLLPLIMTVAKEGRLEEEMFLTTFLFEESKHTEFFRLFLNAVGAREDLSHFHSEPYRKVFYELLPEAMGRLVTDTSPQAIADASVIYNMFVEGVLAETGYWSFYQSLAKFGKMPGLMQGIEYLKKDESRHIAYGTFLLQRLIAEDPSLYDYIVQKLTELAPYAMAINEIGTADSDPSDPMYVRPDEVMAFTAKQLSLRMEKLARAKDKTIEELYQTSEDALGVLG